MILYSTISLKKNLIFLKIQYFSFGRRMRSFKKHNSNFCNPPPPIARELINSKIGGIEYSAELFNICSGDLQSDGGIYLQCLGELSR